METQLLTITPEIAKQLLSKNEHNRRVNVHRVHLYAEEMKNGRWHLHHQGIGIFENGHIADGQHRLEAVILANQPIPFLVTTSIPQSAALGIDDHKPRIIGDILKISTGDGWFTLVKTSIIRNLLLMAGKTQKISAETLLNIATEPLRAKIDFVVKHFNTDMQGLKIAPVFAAITTAQYVECPEEIARFCYILKTGISELKQDITVIRLRDFLISAKKVSATTEHRKMIFLKTQQAIYNFCREKQLSRICTPKDLVYPLPI